MAQTFLLRKNRKLWGIGDEDSAWKEHNQQHPTFVIGRSRGTCSRALFADIIPDQIIAVRLHVRTIKRKISFFPVIKLLIMKSALFSYYLPMLTVRNEKLPGKNLIGKSFLNSIAKEIWIYFPPRMLEKRIIFLFNSFCAARQSEKLQISAFLCRWLLFFPERAFLKWIRF